MKSRDSRDVQSLILRALLFISDGKIKSKHVLVFFLGFVFIVLTFYVFNRAFFPLFLHAYTGLSTAYWHALRFVAAFWTPA